MSRDLRELLKKEPMRKGKLSKNHRTKFEAKLQSELHSSISNKNMLWKIAASFLVIIGVTYSVGNFSKNTKEEPLEVTKTATLGSISPELKTIENFYLESIQTEISNLEETRENKELLNVFLEKIGELTSDYKTLTEELNEVGLNEKTINALIENLQIRLKLLLQLKEQLNELKKLNISENENIQV